jgi:hypothetical protein
VCKDRRFVIEWLQDNVVDTGRLPLLLCFLAYMITFVVTRIITRSIRAGRGPFGDRVTSSGVHIHHAVPGVVVLIAGAFLAVGAHGQTGWAEVAGVLVGVGTSLVLDEFALILRLDDVYWSEEGRVSVQAVSLALAFLGFTLIGLNPLQIDGSAGAAAVFSAIITIAIHVVMVLTVVAKGKYRTAFVGIFVPFVAICSAFRLARPESRWARRHYHEHQLERARARAARYDRLVAPVTDRLSSVFVGDVGTLPPANAPDPGHEVLDDA